MSKWLPLREKVYFFVVGTGDAAPGLCGTSFVTVVVSKQSGGR